VTTTTPANNSTVTAPPSSYVVNFTDMVDPSSLDASDLLVNGHPADGVTLSASQTTATFTFSVNPLIIQGAQTLSLAAGSIMQAGSSGAVIPAYNATFFTTRWRCKWRRQIRGSPTAFSLYRVRSPST